MGASTGSAACPTTFRPSRSRPIQSAGAPTPGWYLLNSGPYAMALDTNGTPVWYTRAATIIDVDALTPNTISFVPDATTPFGYGSTEFAIHDLAAGTVTTVEAVGSATDDHELRLLPNGDHLLLTYPFESGVDLTGLQAFGAGETIADCEIQEVDPTGSLVWSWRATDHIDPGARVPRAGHRYHPWPVDRRRLPLQRDRRGLEREPAPVGPAHQRALLHRPHHGQHRLEARRKRIQQGRGLLTCRSSTTPRPRSACSTTHASCRTATSASSTTTGRARASRAAWSTRSTTTWTPPAWSGSFSGLRPAVASGRQVRSAVHRRDVRGRDPPTLRRAADRPARLYAAVTPPWRDAPRTASRGDFSSLDRAMLPRR